MRQSFACERGDPADTVAHPMATRQQAISRTVYRALEEINATQPPEQLLALTPDTVLLGDGGVLDSTGIINLLVAVEDSFSTEFRRGVRLVDEQLMVDPAGPLRTVGTLVSYLASHLAD